jgi:hypothetical protein
MVCLRLGIEDITREMLQERLRMLRISEAMSATDGQDPKVCSEGMTDQGVNGH